MRIAFSSCQDAVRDADQNAWSVLVELPPDERPDHVVLLGDNIYMDYKFGDHLDLGAPRALPLAKFSELMHRRYAGQWAVKSFQRAVRQYRVWAIWDDHDFAWNNSHGGGNPGHEGHVPDAYRRLSRALFEQYRQALAERPAQYPRNPYPDGLVPEAEALGGIQHKEDLAPGIRLHLLDGRSFREQEGGDNHLLGQAQRIQLAKDLLPPPGINLLASGTTLDDWARYADLAWLQAMARSHRIIVLSGDVHQCLFQDKRRPIVELTASALAQAAGWTWLFGKRSESFGMLDITAAGMKIDFWRKGKVRASHRF